VTVCRRSFSLTRKGDLVNDGDEMVVLPTSPTSAVPGGDTCVTSSCLERHMSAVETKKVHGGVTTVHARDVRVHRGDT